MRGEDAYAALGLRPGAGRAEIDQAYRRLIKRYHPDYADGDAKRAAELNRAYSELRTRTRDAPRPHPEAVAAMQRHAYAPRSPSWRGPAFAAAAIAVAVLLASTAAMEEITPPWSQFSSATTAGGARSGGSSGESFSLDQPLAKTLIDSSVGDAIRLHAEDDPGSAAEFSRSCLSRLDANPSVALFDSCAAYDEAIAILAVGNAAFEAGPFNPSAVTARQVGAARLLSADYFEAESRLQQIRARVHMTLLPQLPDARRAADVRVSAPAPAEDIPDVPVEREAVEAPAEPRQTVSRTSPAAEPRRIVSRAAAPPPLRRATPPPVRRATQQQQPVRRAPPQQRAPSVERAAPPAPAAEKRQVPAWQQPLKPAWQRPLPPASN